MVVNCDLEPECVDSELRVALQWIAASELGLPALYFRKSKEKWGAKVGIAVKPNLRLLIVLCSVIKHGWSSVDRILEILKSPNARAK